METLKGQGDHVREPRQLHIRIFLASPSDVADERTLTRSVVDQLRYSSEWRGRLTLDLVAWDNPGTAVAMLATATPQASVAHQLPRPSECDIVIVILWARVGTPLPSLFTKPDGTAYASGTEWEYLDALEAAAKTNRPRILVYRRMEEPVFRALDSERDDKLRQWEWINSFFERFRNRDGSLSGGYNSYLTPDEFRRDLERHLRNLIHEFTTSCDFIPSVALARRTLPPLWEGSPFPGLRAFTAEQAPVFFGRGPEIDDLVRRLADETVSFLAVVGASGSGKSSLVAAGLIPRLQANALEGSRDWRFVSFIAAGPDNNPFKALVNSLSASLSRPEWLIDSLVAKLSAEPHAIDEIVQAVLAPLPQSELLFFIDQFEELFTLVPRQHREPFIRLIVKASNLPRVRIVVTLRADYYARCVEIPELAQLFRTGSYTLAAPVFDSLLEMISKPADRAGLFFDEGLPGRILQDTGKNAGSLPLMAFALHQLYEKRELSGRLTHEAYEAFDGVRGAIVRRAEEVFEAVVSQSLTSAQCPLDEMAVNLSIQQTVNAVFRELVEVDESLIPTRIRTPLSSIAQTSSAAELVEMFVKARLLVAGEGVDPLIEVAHEALLTNWPRLNTWIESVRDDLRLRSQLQRAAVEWERLQDPAYLWSDERCVDAYKRLRQLPYEPTELEWRFLGPLQYRCMLNELEDFATSPDRRALIGIRLALLGDPRRGVGLRDDGLPEIVWCGVPGGKIIAKIAKEDIIIDIAPFSIAKYPLTHAQYGAFLRAPDGYGNAVWWEGFTKRYEKAGRQFQPYQNHPADNVSWVDATAFCRWLTSHLGYEVRLPSEWEWQQAANGGDCSRPFPWGEWELGRANTYEAQLNRTTAVGVFPHGASLLGALDMCGNVWEWCCDGTELYPPDENCPLGYHAVRGGSWNFEKTNSECNSRNVECSAYRFTSVGFRLACSSHNSLIVV